MGNFAMSKGNVFISVIVLLLLAPLCQAADDKSDLKGQGVLPIDVYPTLNGYILGDTKRTLFDEPLVQSLQGHIGWVKPAVWSADKQRVLSASITHNDLDQFKTIKISNLLTGEAVQTLKGHTNVVYSAVWSADEQQVLSASGDMTIKIWNLLTGEAVQTLKGHTYLVHSAVWSADEQRVLSASGDNTIKIWNLLTGEAVQTLEGHTSLVYWAVWSADEQQVLSASGDDTIKIWTLPISYEKHIVKMDVAQAAWIYKRWKEIQSGASMKDQEKEKESAYNVEVGRTVHPEILIQLKALEYAKK